ncbi:uncharacterized protein LOC130509706 [Raphanus sativus]|uniref:Uncharacterized protein LOC130509706 n=1 Tax=Raphanus sativus TaxID=3726 RepID=A0A9W3DDR6_RAPSA|nr:uncharacterized protein LOC130509706 [Raphanus sativus]
MPIQPSFRSRGKSTKAASSSRGSDKNQGGSFLDSVKEVLDEGGSAPAKGVASSEPKVQEVGLPSEVPMTEADPQMVRDPPEFEPPRNKRSRTDQVDRPSRSSSSSSRGGTVGWNFTHSKPGSVLDDSWGLATLMRHMKSPGCSLPSISNLTHKDEYVDIAHHMGQLAGAINRAQFKFEDAVHNAPSAEELAQVTELVKANKTELNQTRALISDLDRPLLISTSQNSQKNKEAEVRLAVRRGKKEVAEAYNKILVIVKEKFSKKKDEVDLLVHAQDIQANTELLKDILDGEIKSAQDEYDHLVAIMPEAVAAYEKAQVSDFSIGKLPLPQLSESSGTFEVNMFNLFLSGEFGSNLGLVGSYSAPVETASGGNDREMEEEVPEEEDPVGKGAEKSSDNKEV